MDKKKIKVIGNIVAVIGFGLNLASMIIEDKKTDIEIKEKVAEAIAKMKKES